MGCSDSVLRALFKKEACHSHRTMSQRHDVTSVIGRPGTTRVARVCLSSGCWVHAVTRSRCPLASGPSRGASCAPPPTTIGSGSMYSSNEASTLGRTTHRCIRYGVAPGASCSASPRARAAAAVRLHCSSACQMSAPGRVRPRLIIASTDEAARTVSEGSSDKPAEATPGHESLRLLRTIRRGWSLHHLLPPTAAPVGLLDEPCAGPPFTLCILSAEHAQLVPARTCCSVS